MALSFLVSSAVAGEEVGVWCSIDAAGRPSNVKAVCDLRSTSRAAINESDVSLERSSGSALDFDFVAFQPRVNNSVILFLIQTGGKSHPNDSAREIKRLIRHEGLRKFGVYTVAGDVTRFTRLGASPQQIDNGLSRRRSRESGSALLSALDASLDDLASFDAMRKAIVLLGDGSHAGDGLSVDDIIAKAVKFNVPIHAIAMTDNRVDDSIKNGMKVLRSLAENTGGVFEDAGPNRIVSDSYINDFYHFVENGGEARISSYLSSSDTVDASVGLSNGRTVKVAGIPIRGAVARASPTSTSPSSSATDEDTRSSAAADDTSSESASNETSDSAGEAGSETASNEEADSADSSESGDDEPTSDLAALLEDPLQWASDNPFPAASAIVAILGLAALGAIVLMRPKRQSYEEAYDGYGDGSHGLYPEPALVQVADQDTVLMGGGPGVDEPVVVPGHDPRATLPAGVGISHPHVYGYLEFLDSDATRAPLSATNVRIGRHRDNDICIANHSVHRQHAVIYKDAEGDFIIKDLGTKNGTFVNNVRCSQTKLNDGDVIELGEVKLRYAAAVV